MMSRINVSTSMRLQFGAAVAALLLVSFMIIRVSSAAFTSTTDTPGNWSAGSVTLTDDDGTGSVAFTNDTGMVPGNSDQACIKLTYNGDVATAGVKMYGSTAFTSASDLGDHLTLTIEDVTIGSLATCDTATVNATLFSAKDLSVSATSFTVSHTDWSNGLATGWSPSAAGETKTYRITVTLQDADAAQGLNTAATFTWETQNA